MLVLLQAVVKLALVPFLRLFLIVLERFIVAQGRSRQQRGWGRRRRNNAQVEENDVVPKGPRHGCREIAAEAVIHGSVASAAAL
ncbi:hypothetical protein [Mesorhizobium sp. INR15]|uniref:hypothetical protein n=1 Tax=Mesorhizobium sp. INR15 TaxID=2654248 RepID=UPI001896418D|nr:hypothetical protein [Mesorhizobium sp. INR15]QPC94252.1 hypothetical protein GA829_28720 [Mesorhizobium sp. INR15]